MRNYVIINGVNSNTIQGLAINILPPITKPMMRSQIEEIDGRDGDLVTELGYSAYDKQMEIGLWGTYDIDAIIKYFTGEGTIVFSNEPDKFYNFKIINQIDYDKLLKFKKATITLHCQPFKYPVEETPIQGETINVSGSGSNITLDNTVVAPMEMKLKGNTIQDGTPTPDTPIPIHTVSGDNTINVEGKNALPLLHEAGYTITNNGIKYTYNNDGSISVKGLATSNSTEVIANQTTTGLREKMLSGNYFLSGCPSGGSNNTYRLQINGYKADGTGTLAFFEAGYQVNAFVNQNYDFVINIYVANGQNVDITFYPQLEKGNSKSSYQPYESHNYPISLGVENLLDMNFSNEQSTVAGARFTHDENSFKLKGTTTGTYKIFNMTNNYNIVSGKTYTIKATIKGINPKMSITAKGFDSSNNQLFSIYANNNNNYLGTFTTSFSATLHHSTFVIESLTNGVYYDLEAIVELVEGDTPQYATYTPIELCKIGTYQDKIDKSSGKNLFDKDNPIFVNGYVNYNTGIFSAQSSSNQKCFYIKLTPNTTYTWSNYVTSASVGYGLYSDIPSVGNTANSYGQISDSKTITTGNEDNYLVMFYSASNATVNFTQFQLEKNSVVTEFEPYGTNWYLKKEIGKVVLDGTENWSVLGTTGDVYKYYTSNYSSLISGLPTTTQALSTHFEFYGVVSNIDYANGFFLNMSGGTTVANGNMSFTITGITSANNFKNWLSTNNTTVYYVLATPTYETITDTTLIEQLEALKPYSYNPTTNITQTNNDAPFELDVSLSYTNTMNVNNVGNIYAKPILELEGSGTIGIILNDIEVLSVDLGTDEKITIDVPNLQAYNPDNDVLLNRNVTGDYMKLLINDGDNTIAFSGSVTSATLTNYTRWI